jgi:hypothetical protein
MTIHAAGQAPRETRADSRTDRSGPYQRIPDLDAFYTRLVEADEAGDAQALAGLVWELYGLLGLVIADLNTLRARLHQALTTAA